MFGRAFPCLMLVLLAGLPGRADLTLRYTMSAKTGSALPAAMSGVAEKQLANIPSERFVRIKGDKTQSTSGALTVIVDNASGEITLIDPAAKRYARMPLAEFATAIEKSVQMPGAAQQALQSMKFDIENNKTGQVGMVAGFRAEERLMTMTVSMDLPGVGAMPGPMMRMELHTWVASPGEVNRIPSLGEYAASVERAARMFGTADQVEKMFSQIPGLGEKLRAATEGMSKDPGSLTVKTTETVYMPIMAKLAPGADVNAPLMELRTDLAQISTDAIDDSLFEVPADFEEASAEVIFKALVPAPPAPPALSSAASPGIARRAGISQPAVIYKRDPEYTEEARKARVSGAVQLSVLIDTEGQAKDIQVVRSLDPGLDQKAIEAVARWRWRPGQKDGQPVNVRATIAVSFKLVDRPRE